MTDDPQQQRSRMAINILFGVLHSCSGIWLGTCGVIAGISHDPGFMLYAAVLSAPLAMVFFMNRPWVVVPQVIVFIGLLISWSTLDTNFSLRTLAEQIVFIAAIGPSTLLGIVTLMLLVFRLGKRLANKKPKRRIRDPYRYN